MKNRIRFALILFLMCLVALFTPSHLIAQESDSAVREVIDSVDAYNKILTPKSCFCSWISPPTIRAIQFTLKVMCSMPRRWLLLSKAESCTSKLLMKIILSSARNMVTLVAGTGWGNIPLSDKTFPEGNYLLRAYTNWMRNFDDHYVFTRPFTISGSRDEDWLINSNFALSHPDSLDKIRASLSFIRADQRLLIAEQLQAKIIAGRKTLYHANLMTSVDGSLGFNFNLPKGIDPHHVTVNLVRKEKGSRDVTYSVPVLINRDEKMDLQFMPEGGNLVSGILARVAFKAINEEGTGIDVSGVVLDSKGRQITTFKSLHQGLGSFDLTPLAGEQYTACIQINNKPISFKLPEVKASGLSLRIRNEPGVDSVSVNIAATPDIQAKSRFYYLLAQSRGRVSFGALFAPSMGPGRFNVAKSALQTGITRFTLLDATCHPLAERIIFIDHHDDVRIIISAAKPAYGKRDSVSLAIATVNNNGVPVSASLALSVTDDSQVKPDTTGSDNIRARLLLTDDLKGSVERPGWYFEKGDTVLKATALDNLLLAQGWVKYDWNGILQLEKRPAFMPEHEFVIRGRVASAFNKPLAGSQVLLISKQPTLLLDTVTNAKGEFIFTDLYPADSAAYVLQARRKVMGAFNIGIDLDLTPSPEFRVPDRRFVPWYVNIDSGRLAAIHTRQALAAEQIKMLGTPLKMVEIKANKAIKGSKTVAPGEAETIMDENDMRSLGKLSLRDVLEKKVPGFGIYTKVINRMQTNYFGLKNKKALFIYDGVPAGGFVPNGMSEFDYLDQVLKYIDADEVRGIEVITSPQGQILYAERYLSATDDPHDYIFFEITTYSGSGLFFKKVPGSYQYHPILFASQKQFYSPRYNIKKPDLLLDTRSTIFWEPNVVTGSDGKAEVHFYTGDKTGKYDFIIQGADLVGSVGATTGQLIVK